MDTSEFLTLVLPPTGHYVMTVLSAGRLMQRSYPTVRALAAASVRADAAGLNTYYAVAAFIAAGNRKQANARALKSLFLDLDVDKTASGKPAFPDRKSALVALSKFLADTGLPMPMVVDSGRGWHVYWVLAEELPPEEWQPLAAALKAATKQHGFTVDPAVPADSARVLRPVGTRNHKNGREVTVQHEAGPFAPDVLRQALQSYMTTGPLSRAGRALQTTPSALTAAMAVTTEYPAADAGTVVVNCAQVRWGVENQSDVVEPFWYAMLGIAAHCHDSEAVAVAWSDGHKDFSEAGTLAKLAQWRSRTTGPTTCSKFKDLNTKGCDKCPLAGRITSPVQIGMTHEEVAGPIVGAPDTVAHTVTLPKPYKRTKVGIVVTINGTDIPICAFDIYPVGYGLDESLGYEVVRFHWNRQHCGWQELKFRQAYLVEGSREFPTAIADQGIVLPSLKQTGSFQAMMRSYIDSLRVARSTTTLYTSMGWKADDKEFLLGDVLHRATGREHTTLSSSVQKLGSTLYGTKGTMDNWRRLTSELRAGELYPHMFALGLSLGAPLFKFTGLRGGILSLYGPTGSGKTLAQLLQQSVWGNPEELHYASKYTQNALFHRLSFYNHLPMTVDETTTMADKDLGEFIYWVTQGKDKGRLNKNSEEREQRTWGTTLTLSTNRPMNGKLATDNVETGAQTVRMLELHLPPSQVFQDDTGAGRKFFHTVTNNYGHAGPVMLEKFLTMGPEQLQAVIAAHIHTVKKKYQVQFGGSERFWEGMIVVADYANMLATQLGLIDYPYEDATQFALEQAGMIRHALENARLDDFDMLGEYLNEFVHATITVMHTGDLTPIVDQHRIPHGEVRVRYDVYRQVAGTPFTHGTLMIDRVHFRKWLSSRGGDWHQFSKLLAAEQIDVTPASQKGMLSKHTPIKLPQCYVIILSLVHPRLRGVLNNVDEQARPTTSSEVTTLASRALYNR